jgi:endonuclease G
LTPLPNGQDAIAFLVPHRRLKKEALPVFIVSVDEVERQTGLDFNNLLDDAVEDDIEDDVEEMW